MADLAVYYSTELTYVNYAILSTSVLVIYDWFITMDREIHHFWPVKIKLGSGLFLANRYIPILTNILHLQTSIVSMSEDATTKYCERMLLTILCLQAISGAIVQVVLALRTQALYGNPRLGYSLLFLVAVAFINTNVWLVLNYLHSYIIPNNLPSPATGCLLVGFPNSWKWEQNIAPLAFETIILVLTTYKCVPSLRNPNKSIQRMLFKDGFVGSLVVCITAILALLSEFFNTPGLAELGIFLPPTIGVLTCSRILLNLRDIMDISPTERGYIPPTSAIIFRPQGSSIELEEISVYDIKQ